MGVRPDNWVSRPITHTEPELVVGEYSFDEVIKIMQDHHVAKPTDPIISIHMGVKVFDYYWNLCEERGDPMPMAASFLLGCPVHQRTNSFPKTTLFVIAQNKDGNNYVLLTANLDWLK